EGAIRLQDFLKMKPPTAQKPQPQADPEPITGTPMQLKIRKFFDSGPVTLKPEVGWTLQDLLDHLADRYGAEFVLRCDAAAAKIEIAPEPWEVKGLTLTQIVYLLLDKHRDLRIYVREYGLLFSTPESPAPEGAIPLHQLLKAKIPGEKTP